MKKTISLAIALSLLLGSTAVPNVMVSAANGAVLEETERVDMDTSEASADPWRIVVDNATGDSSKWVYNNSTSASAPGWGVHTNADDVKVEPSSNGYYGKAGSTWTFNYKGESVLSNPTLLGTNPRGREGMTYYSIQIPHTGRHLQYTGGAYKNFAVTFDLQIPNMVIKTKNPYLDIGLIDAATKPDEKLSNYSTDDYISMGETVDMREITIPSGIAGGKIAPRAALIDPRTKTEFAEDMEANKSTLKIYYEADTAVTVTDPITNKEYIQSYETTDGTEYYLNQVINCKAVVDGSVMSLYMKFEDSDEWLLINSYDISALKDKTKRFYITSTGCQLLISNLDIWQRVSEIDTDPDEPEDDWRVVADNVTADAAQWTYNDDANFSLPGWRAYSMADDIRVEPSSTGFYRSGMIYKNGTIAHPLYLGKNPRGREGMIYYSVQGDPKGRNLQYTGDAYKNFAVTFDMQIPNMVIDADSAFLDVGLIDSSAAVSKSLTDYSSDQYISMGQTVSMKNTAVPSKLAGGNIALRSAIIDPRTVEELAADDAANNNKMMYEAGTAVTVTDPITNAEYIQSYKTTAKETYYLNQVINCKVIAENAEMKLYMKFEDSDEWLLINSYDISALEDKTKRFYITSQGCQLLISNLDIWQRASEIEPDDPKNPDPADATRVAVLEENFESYAEGFSNETAYDTGKALKVSSAIKSIKLPEKTYITASANDNRELWIMTEFDIKTENVDSTVTPSISWTGKGGKTVNTLTLNDNYVTLPYVNDSGADRVNTYKQLSDGWNRIRLVMKFAPESESYVGRNKKLYINGNNVHSLTPENSGGKLTGSASDAVYIDSFNINAAGGSTVYIDNLTFTRFYAEEYEDVNYGQLLTSIRKGDEALSGAKVGENITQPIYDTYLAALEKAKAVYTQKPTLSETEAANDELCKAYSKLIFADKAYEICSVSFADKNGADAAYLTDGGRITSVTVKKNADYGKSGVLILALYDKDRGLTNVMSQDKVFDGVAAGDEKTVDFNMDLPEAIDGDYIKVMLFDNIYNITPLTKALIPDNTVKRTIYVAGDSIVSTYDSTYYPRQGWGTYAADYFNDSIEVANHAHSGFTTRTFVGFSNFNKIESSIKEGDILYVSFMANDSALGIKNVSEYDFKNMLRLYADTAKGKGAEIIFITPPPVLYDVEPDDYNGYTALMKETAAEYNAPVIDVWQKSVDLQTEKGRAYVEAAIHINNMDVLKLNFGENINNSANDKIHISEWGAKKIASWITDEMKNTGSVLRYYASGNSFDFPKDIKTSADVK